MDRLGAVLVASLLLNSMAIAQLSFGGKPLGVDLQNQIAKAPLVVMPAVDVEALKAEDELLALSGKARPYRFGFNHAVDLGLENSGQWLTLPNGDRLWHVSIECPGSFSINFEFHDYVVPEGAQVFVYNEAGEYLGAFEEGSNPGNTSLGVAPLSGDRITVEYREPSAVRGQGRLRIGQVTHAYRDVFKNGDDLFDSGSCNNNVICPEGDPWRDQIASVAMIVLGGSGICTGQLINNCNDDRTPYFLTANHCLGNPQNWVFRFNWESPTCGATANAPSNKTVSGASLLVHSFVSDVALLQLNTAPPASYNVYHSGWDKSSGPASSVACIHHPDGDIKKISFANAPVVQVDYFTHDTWNVPAWSDGTTEPGSSGAGLWNQDKRLVGQLFGGDASCSNNVNDYFGRFNISYPLLEPWLGSCGDTHDGYRPTVIGIEEALGQSVIRLAPNPTTGVLTIKLPGFGSGPTRVTVLDALGAVVTERSISNRDMNLTMDLSQAQSGQYMVRVTNSSYSAVQRLMVVH